MKLRCHKFHFYLKHRILIVLVSKFPLPAEQLKRHRAKKNHPAPLFVYIHLQTRKSSHSELHSELHRDQLPVNGYNYFMVMYV